MTNEKNAPERIWLEMGEEYSSFDPVTQTPGDKRTTYHVDLFQADDGIEYVPATALEALREENARLKVVVDLCAAPSGEPDPEDEPTCADCGSAVDVDDREWTLGDMCWQCKAERYDSIVSALGITYRKVRAISAAPSGEREKP